MRTVWTPEQTAFLKANYTTMKTKELLATLTDKSNDQLRWKAKEFKLRKQVTKSKADMTWLENLDDPEACYWWGFIAADGCINHVSLIVAIHERDEEHLKLFCARTGTNISRSAKMNDWHPVPYTMVRTALADKHTLTRLKARFNIVPRKTYTPFNLSEFFTGDRLCYFLAGYMDGDGHIGISKKHSIVSMRIKVHPGWTPALEQIRDHLFRLYRIESTVGSTKEGWALFTISKMRHVIRLYDLIDGEVPIMGRKWKPLDPIRTHCLTSDDRRLKDISVNPSADFGERSLEEELSIAENLP